MSPYRDGLEHLRDELVRLDLLLQRYLASWRADRGGAGEGGGLYVADAQVDRLLLADPMGSDDGGGSGATSSPDGGHSMEAQTDAGGAPGGRKTDGDFDAEIGQVTETIRRREAETLADGVDLPLAALADRFSLERRHRDVLLVALAPELDLKYETIYAYLHDDLTRKRPTAGLALRIAAGTVGSEAEGRGLFTPGSPLLDHGLLRMPTGDDVLLSRPIEVDRRIVAFLLNEEGLDPSLEGIAWITDIETALPMVALDDGAGTSVDRLPLPAATRNRLDSIVTRLDGDQPVMAHFHGPYGSGRTAAAAALADTIGWQLMSADADRIPSDTVVEKVARLRREATLRDAAIHIANLPTSTDTSDETGSTTVQRLLDGLDEFDGPVILTGDRALPSRAGARLETHGFVSIAFERPSYDLRRSQWERVDLPVDATELASKFQFTPGQIEDAVVTARSQSIGEPTAEDVYEACRAQTRDRLGDLARRIEPNYTWDDIVLPDDERRQLREVAAHINHRGTVYSEWGFENRISLGTGVNVLFAGPSGTGKTMAAEILAGEAGLDLYKVDLANVVSKYIGETESNLGRVFDAAEASNALLFFDEADALFGERSEVSDAHDRYANIEVDYLLERMEEHDGVVLLATNLEENLDDAFQRRLNMTVEFPLPDRDAREAIWRGVFPDDTPVGDLDWEFLADFELTGGSIKNAALTSAFLAADEDPDGKVEMRHVVYALWRELQKGGRLVSADDFGKFRNLLPWL